MVQSQLQQLAGARNNDSEEWTARLIFLQEALEKHVREEESTSFICAYEEFDSDELQKLGEQFLQSVLEKGTAQPQTNGRGPDTCIDAVGPLWAPIDRMSCGMRFIAVAISGLYPSSAYMAGFSTRCRWAPP